jgi:hypothetical protein
MESLSCRAAKQTYSVGRGRAGAGQGQRDSSHQVTDLQQHTHIACEIYGWVPSIASVRTTTPDSRAHTDTDTDFDPDPDPDTDTDTHNFFNLRPHHTRANYLQATTSREDDALLRRPSLPRPYPLYSHTHAC